MSIVERALGRNRGPVSRRSTGVGLPFGDRNGPQTARENTRGIRASLPRYFSRKASPLARKIITFNLIALNVLVAGILYLNNTRESLVLQRASALVGDAELVANVFEARLTDSEPMSTWTQTVDIPATLAQLSLRNGLDVYVFDRGGALAGQTRGTNQSDALTALAPPDRRRTVINDGLTFFWSWIKIPFSRMGGAGPDTIENQLRKLMSVTIAGGTQVKTGLDTKGGRVISATTPILWNGTAVGIIGVASPSGEIDALVRGERERVLEMFVVATLVSIGLSLVLASTIATPLSELAEAAELGRDRNARSTQQGRIRIPDLSGRPDEIGHLSRALSGMVAALYNRIEGNEQFAADVAHEIKNPLASLQSAVGTLRMVQREDQRTKLLGVIEHDVRRLDRLVSDISNASRLDAELVKEDEETFDLLKLIGNLNQYLGEDARGKGIAYLTDLPRQPIMIQGLEARLAQVFVNLISNAVSFCEDGDAIRVWARKRENRVLVVVEDTGPGIPEQALSKVFKRFYSQRPEEHFGNNSGLGLAISKQIIEAHGGVIWAENIRPTAADITSEPLGARFVVGLPV
ncbi:sensor histidine kinase [Sedimentitalea nanhaiensis]|uniref:histidine kinase n=1 Tax=Sedimentitalea nanhaiensis TaxID=999627 RepID=A0A1I7BM33_9RHOB|nr:sensor histidine kinase [Sedimentitalea nanhaiensis]SFT88240.1 two-component system, OmpR family, sensor histidine kinase ChvG [Sedimentitalea nanhaiensis]